jgi:lysozyme family protein
MDFDTAFAKLIGNEGGYTWNAKDPGGETKFGISKRSYPNVDIKALTLDGAKAIYRRDFWDVLGDIDDNLKFQVFDFAVNSGVQTAIRKLQKAIGVADDGHWGPVSAAKLAALPARPVILMFLAERLDFMRKLTTWSTFGSGWAGRIANDLRIAAGAK